jgi:ATP-dependent helicase/nuclease subunit A
LAEATGVLHAPTLAHLFDPAALCEVTLTARPVALAGRALFGAIDRLIIGQDRILAVDFKSNAVVPDRVHEVPEGILRQMGAYAEMLEQIYPGKQVEVAIVWTRNAQLMPLPRNIVRDAFRRHTFP